VKKRAGCRRGSAGALVLLLGLSLAGCFKPPAPVVQATLIFSDFVGPVGDRGEVKVSVASMPGGGLAGLVVGAWDGTQFLGLQYDPTQFEITGVEGLNGFQILATFIDNASGEVRFVAVNPAGGLVEGDVAKIVGNRLGGVNFDFQVAKANLQLVDANGALIPDTDYIVSTGKAPPYYVEGGN